MVKTAGIPGCITIKPEEEGKFDPEGWKIY